MRHRRSSKSKTSLPDGRFCCSFTFDGKEYGYTHQLTAGEVRHMKQLAKEFGDEAASQVAWRVPIRGIGMVAENIVAKAALDYIKKHHVNPRRNELSSPSAIVQSTEPVATKVEETNPGANGDLSHDNGPLDESTSEVPTD